MRDRSEIISAGASATDDILRVGVLIDSADVRRWHSTAVSEIELLGFCRVIVFARESGDGAKSRRVWEAARHWLYEAYVLADRRWFGGNDDDALARLPIEPYGGEDTRRVHIDGEWSSASNVAAITAEDLDVLLCLAPNVPADRLAGCARFGAWSLHGPAQLFRLMYDEEFVAPVTMRAHTSTDGERTIYRSFVESDLVSLHRGRRRAAGRAAHLPARRLRDLHRQGWPFITSLPVYAERDPASDPGRSHPTNGTMVRFLCKVARGISSRRLARWLGEEQWFIAYRRVVRGDTRASEVPARLTTVTPPAGRFYADPFLFRRADRRFIFFEDYERRRDRAVISYVEIDERGRHSSPRVALSRDCHLSYPFVFEEGDAVYMLPETLERRTVELYRAASFPDEWTLDRVLLRDVRAADATLLSHEGRLWLFVAIAVDGGRPSGELFLFSSNSLEKDWEPHPMNPVVSDPRSARPAGRVFVRDGHLIRPAQDCSRAYGWRLVFNRIEALTPTDYRETPVGAIEPVPGSGNHRIHSYDSDGAYEVLDGFRVRPRISVKGLSAAPARPQWHRVDLGSRGHERSLLHS